MENESAETGGCQHGGVVAGSLCAERRVLYEFIFEDPVVAGAGRLVGAVAGVLMLPLVLREEIKEGGLNQFALSSADVQVRRKS